MLIVREFRREHLFELMKDRKEQATAGMVTSTRLNYLERNGYSRSIFDKTAKLVGICGVVPVWAHRAEGWAILGSRASQYPISLTKTVRRLLDFSEFKRIEASVRVGNAAAIRWASVLGFKCEVSFMDSYFPDGEAGALFARVKHG